MDPGQVLEQERKQEEVDFHNQRERDRLTLDSESFHRKYSNKKFYSIARKSRQFVDDWLSRRCPGKTALDYCCGIGGTSLDLAERGAGMVYGIDISDEEVATAARRCAEAGFGDRTKFQVMDAERLTFPEGFFDLAVCSGVLHHLDLKSAYPELARVLKPTGEIVCIEALGYNPLINWYRRRTPHLRTSWEVDHILTLREVRMAEAHFGKAEVRFFHLFTILAVPFRSTFLFRPLLAFLEAVDSVVLRIPGIRLMAWQMVFVLSEPQPKAKRDARLAD